MPFIFVVDSMVQRREFTRSVVEEAGYSVASFSTLQAIENVALGFPDLLLIAVNPPRHNEDAFATVIHEERSLTGTRVVVVANSSEEGARTAQELGADDFIVSPFTPTDLVSCIKAILQNIVPLSRPGTVTDQAEVVINSSGMRLMVRGKEVPTTTLEFRLVDYMARHRGKVFTRDALLDAVWGDIRFVTPRSVDACVGRIRKKIERNHSAPAYLKTVRGIGYKLDAPTAWETASSEHCQCFSCSLVRMRFRVPPKSSSTRTGP